MDSPDCASPGQEKSGSEESGSECCCEACRHADSTEDSMEQPQTAFTKLRDAPRTNARSPTAGQEELSPPSVPVLQTLSVRAVSDSDFLTMTSGTDLLTVTPDTDILTVTPNTNILTVTQDTGSLTVTPNTDILTATPDSGNLIVTPDTSSLTVTPDRGHLMLTPDTDMTLAPEPSALTVSPDTSSLMMSPDTDSMTVTPDMDSMTVTPDMGSMTVTPDTSNLTVAIKDLHARQAQLKARKQRRCAFCRIHGFPVDVKGHKAFCQFRERCTCRGCMLIRCTQRVSKNQVRLRRQKDMETDLESLTPAPFSTPSEQSLTPAPFSTPSEQSLLDSSKKSPMCFKCWVHDSVRVRLKGHRTLCPYARCACSNCALNTDRKWLTRQLRQLTAAPKKEEDEGVGATLETLAALCHSPSAQDSLPSPALHHLNANLNADMPINTGTTTSDCCKDNIDLNVFPLRLHKADDWHPNMGHRVNVWHLDSGLSSLSGIKQNGVGGFSTNPIHSGTLCQEAGYPVPSAGRWAPPSSSHQMNLSPAVYGNQWSSSDNQATNSSYDSACGVTTSPGRGCQSGGPCRWYPQPPASYMTSNAGLVVMSSNAAHFPQSPAFSLSPQCFQCPLQSETKFKL